MMQHYKYLLQPATTASIDHFGCTCSHEYSYHLGFTDCWGIFLTWSVEKSDVKKPYLTKLDAQKTLESCPLHGKEIQVEPIHPDYPWTPTSYIPLIESVGASNAD
jgi:hypothetical protein